MVTANLTNDLTAYKQLNKHKYTIAISTKTSWCHCIG